MTFPMRGEFDFIQDIKGRFDLKHVGDDCAVLPRDGETDLLVTADLMVEGVDFRLEWAQPEFLGHKALAVSLSDIAAMGGRPLHALVSIGVSEAVWSSDFIDRFYSGWHGLAHRHNVEMVGGDVSRTPGPVVIDSVVLGTVPKGFAVRRSGASPGDAVFVSGCLGGAAGGLLLLEDGVDAAAGSAADKLNSRQLLPEPRVDLGVYLLEMGIASAMIDISDGLSSDLRHLCSVSGVGATIAAERIPVDPGLREHFDANTAFEMAMSGGEDFELLFTDPPEKISLIENRHLHRIGEITESVAKIELTCGSEVRDIPASGYVHF
jgi:thiamine-monophosphate kinase